MKNIKLILVPLLMMCCAEAQTQPLALPYNSGFETYAQNTGWQSIRTGVHSSFDWSVSAMNGNHFLYHDYPVGGSSADTVSDWYMSPPLRINAGARLSFRYSVYGISGTATPSDQFSIWYGKRSANPQNGTFVQLLDLTSRISNSDSWKDTLDVLLPFAADTGYIAFRYRATNNWFTVSVDSVAVRAFRTDVKDIKAYQLSVMPNPVNDILEISGQEKLSGITIVSSDGKMIYTSIVPAHSYHIDTGDWSQGTYIVTVPARQGVRHAKVIKQ